MIKLCIAVIGADVALDLALHGHAVWLRDVSAEKLGAATANWIR